MRQFCESKAVGYTLGYSWDLIKSIKEVEKISLLFFVGVAKCYGIFCSNFPNATHMWQHTICCSRGATVLMWHIESLSSIVRNHYVKFVVIVLQLSTTIVASWNPRIVNKAMSWNQLFDVMNPCSWILSSK